MIEADQKKLELFAFYIGLLVGIFRFPNQEKPHYAFVQICHSSKTIAEIIHSLKKGEYHPYYLTLRKIIIDWSDREKKGLNALGNDWQKVNIIFSAL